MSWAIQAFFVIAAIATLFASRPKRKSLAIIATIFLILSATSTSYTEHVRSRAEEAARLQTYLDLDVTVGKAIGLLNQMVIAGSDGWIPSSHEELFSIRVAYLICDHLNIESNAPVVPHRPWLSWIDQRTKEVHEELTAVIRQQTVLLDPEVLDAIASLRDSFFLAFPGQWRNARSWDAKQGYQRPPLLCYGLAPLVHESLESLKVASDIVREQTGQAPRSAPVRRDDVAPRLGVSHYSSSDIEAWEKAHPFAPSGQPHE